MVGTFQRAAKDRPPLVVEGGSVAPGARLAIVEAMQVPKDVIATISGRIVKILVESGRPVEYGQPLFEIEPTEG
jgi:acetyl-CoA carboxylase biotin carboxyl carrier protein